jgi:hypothetical protein
VVNIGVNLPSVNVGVTLGNTTPSVQPTAPTPTQQHIMNPNIVTQQLLMPMRDINGTVVKWTLQTIEYDRNLTNPPNAPKNFASLAPWSVPFRLISTP